MSQVLRNVKALGAEQEGTVHWCPVPILSCADSAPLDFKSHVHGENTGKASYECRLLTLLKHHL